MISAAAPLFAELGYARTTLAKIAAAAGVSVETVQTCGSKAALMIAAVEYSAFGQTGDRDIMDTEFGRDLKAIEDRDGAATFTTDYQTELHHRAAATTRALLGGAAADPTLDGYLRDLTAGIGRQSRRVLQHFADRGWLRTDLPFDEVVETAAVISGVEVYLRMVDRDGWSTSAYRQWLRRMFAEVIMSRAE